MQLSSTASNSFLLVTSLLILFGYFIQATAAFVHAYSTKTILKVFAVSRFVDTWLIVATIFFGPLLISWISNAIELQDEGILKVGSSLVLSMLMIYITLEFSQLGSLNSRNRDWRTLLLVALFLDIGGVVLVTIVSRLNDIEIGLIYALGLISFLSSFMIILFAKIAGEDDENPSR